MESQRQRQTSNRKTALYDELDSVLQALHVLSSKQVVYQKVLMVAYAYKCYLRVTLRVRKLPLSSFLCIIIISIQSKRSSKG